MTTGAAPATTTPTTHDDGSDRGRTPAQWFAYLAGATLLLAGLLGFIADATFDTGLTGTDDDGGNVGGALQGDSFLGFEVNGWHNVVHILSGLLLLAVAPKRRTAKLGTLAFGVLYGIVTVVGFVDGNDVLGLFPVNLADNLLHLALSAAAILAALASRGDDREDLGHGTARPTTERRAEPAAAADEPRFERRPVAPRDLDRTQR